MKNLILAAALLTSSTVWAANSLTDAVTSTLVDVVILKHQIELAKDRPVNIYLDRTPRYHRDRGRYDRHTPRYDRDYRRHYKEYTRCGPEQSYYTHRDYVVITHRDACSGELLWEKRIPR